MFAKILVCVALVAAASAQLDRKYPVYDCGYNYPQSSQALATSLAETSGYGAGVAQSLSAASGDNAVALSAANANSGPAYPVYGVPTYPVYGGGYDYPQSSQAIAASLAETSGYGAGVAQSVSAAYGDNAFALSAANVKSGPEYPVYSVPTYPLYAAPKLPVYSPPSPAYPLPQYPTYPLPQYPAHGYPSSQYLSGWPAC